MKESKISQALENQAGEWYGNQPRIREKDGQLEVVEDDEPEDAEVNEWTRERGKFEGVHPNHVSQIRGIFARRNYAKGVSVTGCFA